MATYFKRASVAGNQVSDKSSQVPDTSWYKDIYNLYKPAFFTCRPAYTHIEYLNISYTTWRDRKCTTNDIHTATLRFFHSRFGLGVLLSSATTIPPGPSMPTFGVFDCRVSIRNSNLSSFRENPLSPSYHHVGRSWAWGIEHGARVFNSSPAARVEMWREAGVILVELWRCSLPDLWSTQKSTFFHKVLDGIRYTSKVSWWC